jgi:hypothetical protein
MKEVDAIMARYPEVAIEEVGFNPPSYCDSYGEMIETLQGNVRTLGGV